MGTGVRVHGTTKTKASEVRAAFEVERSAQLLMQEFGVLRWREQVDAAPIEIYSLKVALNL